MYESHQAGVPKAIEERRTASAASYFDPLDAIFFTIASTSFRSLSFRLTA